MQKSLDKRIDAIVKHMVESFNNGDDAVVLISNLRWDKTELARRFMASVGLDNYKEESFALLPSNTVIVCKQTESPSESFSVFLKDSGFKQLDINDERVQFWIRHLNNKLTDYICARRWGKAFVSRHFINELAEALDKSDKAIFRSNENNLLRQQKRWRDRYNRCIKK